jgi:hypothetical protein
LRRYIYLDWPVEDLFKTVGLGLAFGALYALGDWVTKQPGKENPRVDANLHKGVPKIRSFGRR